MRPPIIDGWRRQAIAERIDKRRRDEDFQQRLRRLIDENQRVLERIAE